MLRDSEGPGSTRCGHTGCFRCTVWIVWGGWIYRLGTCVYGNWLSSGCRVPCCLRGIISRGLVILFSVCWRLLVEVAWVG